jgi:hypothetical protein
LPGTFIVWKTDMNSCGENTWKNEEIGETGGAEVVKNAKGEQQSSTPADRGGRGVPR